VPAVMAAKVLGIPSITHESDFDPGLATRINTLFSDLVLTSFKESSRYFSKSAQGKLIYCGNPVRPEITKGDARQGRLLTGCPVSKKMILVLGGSQGSAGINSLIEVIIEDLVKKYFLVHQVGRKNTLPPYSGPYYHTVPFLGDELPHILAASDLVISRAGANTLWELAVTATPSILIPLGITGSRGDQLRNAAIFEQAGASIVLKEETLTGQILLETILNLLDNKATLHNMSEAAGRLGIPDAAHRIVEIILRTIRKKEDDKRRFIP
jgi:UDP-N-acetylglucosamine--N-acetylmuramyl-(pentapeptide) pyrophosphoryl-undecaprenol N-acetylglucosamine transferase